MAYLEIILVGLIINILMFIVLIVFSVILSAIENSRLDVVKRTQNQIMIRKKMSEYVYTRNNIKLF